MPLSKAAQIQSTIIRSEVERGADTLTQSEQPVLLLQPFELLRHKRLHLLDVHPSTLLQSPESKQQSERRSAWPHLKLLLPTHIVRRLQVPGLLTEEAEDVGEVLVPDLTEDLKPGHQRLRQEVRTLSRTTEMVPHSPYPESSASPSHSCQRR